jgi:hypothetical protein
LALAQGGGAQALLAGDGSGAIPPGGSLLVVGPGDQAANDSRAGRREVVLVTPPQGPVGSPLLVSGPSLPGGAGDAAFAGDTPALPAEDVHALALRSVLDNWGSGTSAWHGGMGQLAEDLELPAILSVLGDQGPGQSPWVGGAPGESSAHDVAAARPQTVPAAVAGGAVGTGEAGVSDGLLGKVVDLLTALGGGFFGAALLNLGTHTFPRVGCRPAMGQRPQGDEE